MFFLLLNAIFDWLFDSSFKYSKSASERRIHSNLKKINKNVAKKGEEERRGKGRGSRRGRGEGAPHHHAVTI